MTWREYAGTGVRFAASESESRRFGITIGRLTVGDGTSPAEAGPQVEALLRNAVEDLVIVRYPAQAAVVGAAIAASGRTVIPADVLMYWDAPTAQLEHLQSGPESQGITLDFGHATSSPDLLEAVETVVADSFRGYGNHYSANPRLDPELALAGYIEWALRTVQNDPANVVVLRQHGTPIGMATLCIDTTMAEAEILLAGLVETAQGHGHYPRLLQAVARHAHAHGCTRVTISTQAHNIRVQRAWTKAGLRPFAAITTIHATKPTVRRQGSPGLTT